MRLTRSSLRPAAVVAATFVALIGAALVPSTAQAAGAPASGAALTASVARADGVAASLGDRSAGTYLDLATGRMVVTVADEAAAELVRANGFDAKVVARSGAQLAAITDLLYRTLTVTGTAWAVDPITNQVVVSYDSTVKGAGLRQVLSTVEGLGAAARLEYQPGTFSTRITGGDAIYGGGYRCSLGFNVHSGNTYYFLTAGHCGDIVSTWYANSSRTTVLGTVAGSSFPGNDYAIVRYTNTSIAHPSTVGSVNITGAGTPAVNQSVTRRGSTTGTRTGRVTQLNATVRYAEGTVSGLIRTTVCAEGGDSGGALYGGSTAYGLTSGGSGNCSSGGVTYFQPVTEALNAYGVTLP